MILLFTVKLERTTPEKKHDSCVPSIALNRFEYNLSLFPFAVHQSSHMYKYSYKFVFADAASVLHAEALFLCTACGGHCLSSVLRRSVWESHLAMIISSQT